MRLDKIWRTRSSRISTWVAFLGMSSKLCSTIEATRLPREYASRRVQLWMGPDAHLVAYPISGARKVNIVAAGPGSWSRPGWSASGEITEIKNAFASSH